MSRAQPTSSPTGEFARRIAQAIAKGRPPPVHRHPRPVLRRLPTRNLCRFQGSGPPHASSRPRCAVAGALVQVADSPTPTEVRRLIAMRNWRPERERAEMDAIIRKARAAGIDCAPWSAGSMELTVATSIDGAMAQAFLLISPAGRKKRFSSILIKDGIADALGSSAARLGKVAAAAPACE